MAAGESRKPLGVMRPLPNGVWPVVLTPFCDDRSIDWGAFERLIDWHVRAGAAGLFVCAGSAEVLTLTADEQVEIARTAMDRVAARVPVIAGGIRAGGLTEQIKFIRRIAAADVACVVISTSILRPKEADDDEWIGCVERILNTTEDVALGTYEMPQPYHRLLSPSLLGRLAETGRFFFHKDTSGDADAIRAKISAARDSPLRFFNADTPTLPASLEAGGHGFSGIGANFVPELYAWYCGHRHDRPATAARVYAFLAEANRLMHTKYMTSAKAFLAMRGLRIRPVCRAVDHRLVAEDECALRKVHERFHSLCGEVGITPCMF